MKVLVPYDGAELSEQAAAMAIELLAQHRLELIVLRVIGDPEQVVAAEESLEGVTRRLATSPASVTTLLALGHADEKIVECADQYGADLIAMSTHGRPMLARMLLGSVTDRVIRTSPVPVLVVHPPTMSTDLLSPPARRRLRVLAPLDGSPFAEEAVVMAASLLRPELIDVTLLGVQNSPDSDLDTTHQMLVRAAGRLRAGDAQVATVLDQGDAAQRIARTAIDGSYDLVVMSTHGRSTLSRMLVGSVTDKVVRMSEVPVLVIQPHSMETPFDPVSGENVNPEQAAYASEYHSRTFYFTSFDHKTTFDSAPEAFVGRRTARVGLMPSPYEGMAREPSYMPPATPEA